MGPAISWRSAPEPGWAQPRFRAGFRVSGFRVSGFRGLGFRGLVVQTAAKLQRSASLSKSTLRQFPAAASDCNRNRAGMVIPGTYLWDAGSAQERTCCAASAHLHVHGPC